MQSSTAARSPGALTPTAPSTPRPPARLIAAATCSEGVNPTVGCSMPSGGHSDVIIYLPPSRAVGPGGPPLVVPEARKRAEQEAGPRRRDTATAPGAASCRRRADRHCAAFGPAPAAAPENLRRLADGVSSGVRGMAGGVPVRPRVVGLARGSAADGVHEPDAARHLVAGDLLADLCLDRGQVGGPAL